jgi:hypothetical protein
MTARSVGFARAAYANRRYRLQPGVPSSRPLEWQLNTSQRGCRIITETRRKAVSIRPPTTDKSRPDRCAARSISDTSVFEPAHGYTTLSNPDRSMASCERRRRGTPCRRRRKSQSGSPTNSSGEEITAHPPALSNCLNSPVSHLPPPPKAARGFSKLPALLDPLRSNRSAGRSASTIQKSIST